MPGHPWRQGRAQRRVVVLPWGPAGPEQQATRSQLGRQTVVRARKADVTVSVWIYSRGRSAKAETQARKLVEGILYLVRRDTTEG